MPLRVFHTDRMLPASILIKATWVTNIHTHRSMDINRSYIRIKAYFYVFAHSYLTISQIA